METTNSSVYATSSVNALPLQYQERKLSLVFRICALALIIAPMLFFLYLLYSVGTSAWRIIQGYDGMGFVVFLLFVFYILIMGFYLLSIITRKLFKKPVYP